MKKAAIAMILALVLGAFLPAQASVDFSRGIAHYLIGDLELARKDLDAHFRRRPQPTVKVGFVLLLQNEKWEATKKFRDFLESNHRSLEALTGISLATADMKNSMTMENLGKILRMNPGYAPAYLCLAYEHSLRRNYPVAEDYYLKSLKYAAIPEFKILLAEMYLKSSQPTKALELIRPEAVAAPKNYYFTLLAAKACLRLDDCPDASVYIEQALGARPKSRDAQLLAGQYSLKKGDYRRAKSQLQKLKFEQYNPEFSLTLAEVLLRLKDRDAEKYLYEVFSQQPWNPKVNRLLALFHAGRKKADVQNWIRRAALSGLPGQDLAREFPSQAPIPEIPSLPMFEAKKIQWLGNRHLLVAGILHSGEKEKLLVLDAPSMKVIKTFDYEGTIQEVFVSPGRDRVVFSTTAVENEKVYLYTLLAAGASFRLKPVIGYALNLPTVLVAFDAGGSKAYVCDGSLAELAFTSPFAAVSAMGRKAPVYPEYPFSVFSYSYANDRWAQVRKAADLRAVPLPALEHYLAVADACRANADVAKLLDEGAKIDITSSQEMKIHFGPSADHFLIQISDLKNAFQAWVYDGRSNKLSRFDETMFLGEKYYAEIDIVALHPETSEIVVLTRDKQRNLIHFNFHSLLYKRLGSNVLTARLAPDRNTLYFLNERNKHYYYSEAVLEVVRLSPYGRSRFDSRRDLDAIVDCSDRGTAYFTTYNGELVKMDEEGNFSVRQVSLRGCLHQASPDQKKAAAFINGRLYVLEWMR
ncbi:MAG: hypothetical protein JXO51_00610 [Candidatus Aminicenantes bacterium]|nr:hypothetical protein [Candidatus Aminicenantes bacterium]